MSTQEIVQRLRATQPARFAARSRRFGGVLLLATLGVWGFNALRFNLFARLAGRRSTVTESAAVTSAAPTPPQAEAPAAPPVHVEGSGVRLSIRVRGAPSGAELRIDGATVGPATHWEGRLARGAHAVAVHSQAGDYAHVVQLQAAQEVVFELGSKRVHARKLHDHGRTGR